MVDTDYINRPTWKPRFVSEYSMGEYDFKRYDAILTEIDTVSGFVNSIHSPSLELMQKYISLLANLYDNWRPLISIGSVQQELDDMIKEGTKLKRVWEGAKQINMPMNQKIIIEFVDLCNAIKKRLFYIKQVIGLGIVVKRNMSVQERIKKGIRGHGKAENLPEA